MAERRMFAKTIIDSDEFLDMPLSAQALYFHLGMRADDDGFLNNARKILGIIRASDDDLKILLAKRFLILFEGGIIVIKHWRMNNLLRSDRYKETNYTDEKAQLEVKKNGAYTHIGIPDGNQLATRETQYRLGKDSLGQDSTHTERAREEPKASGLPGEYLRTLYDTWQGEAALPRLPEYLGFSLSQFSRRTLAAIRGTHSDDVLAAIKNYGMMAADPRDYWPKQRPSIAAFFEGELFLKCIPANFPQSCLTDEKKKDDEWARAKEKVRKECEGSADE